MDPAEKSCLVARDGSIKGFWEGIALGRVKEEPDEGLQQRWEAQWQLIGYEVPQLLFGSLKETQQPEDALLAKDKAACRKIKDEFPVGEEYEEVILRDDTVAWDAERQRFREQILEQLILEQFLAILPPEMQSWVKAHCPDSCPQAVALAEGFLVIQKQEDDDDEVPGPLQKEAGDFPKVEGPLWDSSKCPLFREIKQESDSNPTAPGSCTSEGEEFVELLSGKRGLAIKTGGDEEMGGEKDNQGGNSVEAEPPWMLSEEAEPGNSGDSSEDFPRKRKEGLIDFQRCSRGLDKETDQPWILAGEPEKIHHQCGEVFQSWPQFADHQRRCTEESAYEHLACSESFRSGSTLVPHVGDKPYICSACGKSFTDHTVLVAHERTHRSETPFKPTDAEPPFPHDSLPIKDKRAPLGERPYKCSDCEKSFGTRAILSSHKRTHTGEKPYHCPDCGKCFGMTSALIRHKRTHTGEKPYKCLECGRCFGDRSGFNMHVRIHTGEKLYRCLDCGKSFGRQAHLADHERIHTGEKPYQCPECEKRFSSLSILIKHKRTHTGEKPYRCSFCGKSFGQSSSCMKHERTHTGEKPYKCSYCGQNFSQNSSCLRHERTHSGEKSFK
uniref:zinc finger protein 436-like n=1 Tax=Euleptes europaea TaxID=460621 RepID=UPI00253F69BE|nr:zinc finger protein 436-like [Euleptes europaea]